MYLYIRDPYTMHTIPLSLTPYMLFLCLLSCPYIPCMYTVSICLRSCMHTASVCVYVLTLSVCFVSVRYESELSIRQSVEGDIAGLKKVIDDTNLGRMNIEGEIESVKEELSFLQKNHENVSHCTLRTAPKRSFWKVFNNNADIHLLFLCVHLKQEVSDLMGHISQSGVQVDVDAPKGQDLAQVMDSMRANYEKMALKNVEELKMWHENQVGIRYTYKQTHTHMRAHTHACTHGHMHTHTHTHTHTLTHTHFLLSFYSIVFISFEQYLMGSIMFCCL